VLVLASDKVEEACVKSGLTFAELIKPFASTLDNLKAIQFRALSKPTTLRRFGLRVISAAEMAPVKTHVVDAYLRAVVNESVQTTVGPAFQSSLPTLPHPGIGADGIYATSDVPNFVASRPDPTPWWTAYRREFLAASAPAEENMLEQPVAIIVAVSADEERADQKALAMRQLQNLPPQFQRCLYDSTVPTSYVVVVDSHAPLEPAAAAQLLESRQASAHQIATALRMHLKLPRGHPGVAVLSVNSLAALTSPLTAAIVNAAAGGSASSPASLAGSLPSPTTSSTPTTSSSVPAGSANITHITAPSPARALQRHMEWAFCVSRSRSLFPESGPMTRLPSLPGTPLAAGLAHLLVDFPSSSPLVTVEAAPVASPASQQATPQQEAKSPPSVSGSTNVIVKPKLRFGYLLSQEDVNAIQNYLGELTLHIILPAAEKWLLNLSEKVAASSKSFRSSVRAFFGRRDSGPRKIEGAVDGSEVIPTMSPAPRYPLSCVESQTYALASLSLMFQDYETAATYFRQVYGDFKRDKSVQHMAMAQELLAITLSLKEAEAHAATLPSPPYLQTGLSDGNRSRAVSGLESASPQAGSSDAVVGREVQQLFPSASSGASGSYTALAPTTPLINECIVLLKSAAQEYLTVRDTQRMLRCHMWTYDLLRLPAPLSTLYITNSGLESLYSRGSGAQPVPLPALQNLRTPLGNPSELGIVHYAQVTAAIAPDSVKIGVPTRRDVDMLLSREPPIVPNVVPQEPVNVPYISTQDNLTTTGTSTLPPPPTPATLVGLFSVGESVASYSPSYSQLLPLVAAACLSSSSGRANSALNAATAAASWARVANVIDNHGTSLVSAPSSQFRIHPAPPLILGQRSREWTRFLLQIFDTDTLRDALGIEQVAYGFLLQAAEPASESRSSRGGLLPQSPTGEITTPVSHPEQSLSAVASAPFSQIKGSESVKAVGAQQSHLTRLRKYALHMTLAAHAYLRHGFPLLALRCQLSALTALFGRGWQQLTEQALAQAAREMSAVGSYALAVELFSRAIACGAESPLALARVPSFKPLIEPADEFEELRRFVQNEGICEKGGVLDWLPGVNLRIAPALRQRKLLDSLVAANRERLKLNCSPAQIELLLTSPSDSTSTKLLNRKTCTYPGELTGLQLPILLDGSVMIFKHDALHVPPELVNSVIRILDTRLPPLPLMPLPGRGSAQPASAAGAKAGPLSDERNSELSNPEDPLFWSEPFPGDALYYPQSKHVSQRDKATPLPAGEGFTVMARMVNPLSIPFRVSNARVRFVCIPSDSLNDTQETEPWATSGSISFDMRPGESVTLELRVDVNSQFRGLIQIVGLAWSVEDWLHTFWPFKLSSSKTSTAHQLVPGTCPALGATSPAIAAAPIRGFLHRQQTDPLAALIAAEGSISTFADISIGHYSSFGAPAELSVASTESDITIKQRSNVAVPLLMPPNIYPTTWAVPIIDSKQLAAAGDEESSTLGSAASRDTERPGDSFFIDVGPPLGFLTVTETVTESQSAPYRRLPPYLPTIMLQGQMPSAPTTWRLKNSGLGKVSNLRLYASHPAFFLIFVRRAGECQWIAEHYHGQDGHVNVVTELLPGECIEIAVFCRAHSAGRHNVSFLILYQAEQLRSELNGESNSVTAQPPTSITRVLRMAQPLVVLPSVTLALLAAPSKTSIQDEAVVLHISDSRPAAPATLSAVIAAMQDTAPTRKPTSLQSAKEYLTLSVSTSQMQDPLPSPSTPAPYSPSTVGTAADLEQAFAQFWSRSSLVLPIVAQAMRGLPHWLSVQKLPTRFSSAVPHPALLLSELANALAGPLRLHHIESTSGGWKLTAMHSATEDDLAIVTNHFDRNDPTAPITWSPTLQASAGVKSWEDGLELPMHGTLTAYAALKQIPLQIGPSTWLSRTPSMISGLDVTQSPSSVSLGPLSSEIFLNFSTTRSCLRFASETGSLQPYEGSVTASRIEQALLDLELQLAWFTEQGVRQLNPSAELHRFDDPTKLNLRLHWSMAGTCGPIYGSLQVPALNAIGHAGSACAQLVAQALKSTEPAFAQSLLQAALPGFIVHPPPSSASSGWLLPTLQGYVEKAIAAGAADIAGASLAQPYRPTNYFSASAFTAAVATHTAQIPSIDVRGATVSALSATPAHIANNSAVSNSMLAVHKHQALLRSSTRQPVALSPPYSPPELLLGSVPVKIGVNGWLPTMPSTLRELWTPVTTGRALTQEPGASEVTSSLASDGTLLSPGNWPLRLQVLTKPLIRHDFADGPAQLSIKLRIHHAGPNIAEITRQLRKQILDGVSGENESLERNPVLVQPDRVGSALSELTSGLLSGLMIQPVSCHIELLDDCLLPSEAAMLANAISSAPSSAVTSKFNGVITPVEIVAAQVSASLVEVQKQQIKLERQLQLGQLDVASTIDRTKLSGHSVRSRLLFEGSKRITISHLLPGETQEIELIGWAMEPGLYEVPYVAVTVDPPKSEAVDWMNEISAESESMWRLESTEAQRKDAVTWLQQQYAQFEQQKQFMTPSARKAMRREAERKAALATKLTAPLVAISSEHHFIQIEQSMGSVLE